MEVALPNVEFEGVVRVLYEGRVVNYVGGPVDLVKFVDAIRDRSRRLLNRLLSRLAGTSQGGGAEVVRNYLEKIRDMLGGGDVVSTVGFGQGYWGVTVTEFKPELARYLRIKRYRGPDFPGGAQ